MPSLEREHPTATQALSELNDSWWPVASVTDYELRQDHTLQIRVAIRSEPTTPQKLHALLSQVRRTLRRTTPEIKAVSWLPNKT